MADRRCQKACRAAVYIAAVCVLLLSQSYSSLTVEGRNLDRIWRGGFAPASRESAGRTLTVLSWNIERGERHSQVAAAIRELDPGICILQEADLHAKRSGFRHIAGDLARELSYNYVFAAEFRELSQGSGGRPAYHGQATLARFPIVKARIIRFRMQSSWWKPRWFIPNWSVFQRRLGGRMCLVAELDVHGARLVVYNTHLESKFGERKRARQLDEIVDDAARYPQNAAVIVAGDLNTRTAGSSLVSMLKEEGFQSVMETPEKTVEERDSLWAAILDMGRPDDRVLDWIFVRGPVQIESAAVHRQVRASDHYPLTARIRLDAVQVSGRGAAGGEDRLQ